MQEQFALHFVEKMEAFFLEMRDMCRDYVLNLPQEGVVRKKIDKKKSKHQQKYKSAFYYYYQDRKQALLEQYPNLDGKSRIITCGKEWRSLTPEQTQYFQKRAQEVLNIEKELALKELTEEVLEENSTIFE